MLSVAGAPVTSDLTAEIPQSAYIHIPFCRRRCYYCDFPITVVGDRPPVRPANGAASPLNGSNSGTISQYVEVLCTEIELTEPLGAPLETVFFGGGTPSLLSVEQLEQILAQLQHQFGLTRQAEISMEIDPGTFDRAQLQGYRAAGINRVSLGVQAFQPELLSLCGRSHTVAEVYQAIDWVRQVGFTNISLDLISGLPQQTLADWQASLERAIALEPTHLSCYDLTVEPQTAFSRRYQPGLAPLPSDDTTAAMYRLASQQLRAAGYQHYEISNYAQPGYQCRHNRVYWENRPFYGFGMGATSYLQGERLARPRKTREYYAWVQQQQQLGQRPTPANCLITDRSDRLLDSLMLGLRLAEGINLADLIHQFGWETVQRIWNCLRPYANQGWIMVRDGQGDSQLLPALLPASGQLHLTDPEGFLFSNVILVRLFQEFAAHS